MLRHSNWQWLELTSQKAISACPSAWVSPQAWKGTLLVTTQRWLFQCLIVQKEYGSLRILTIVAICNVSTDITLKIQEVCGNCGYTDWIWRVRSRVLSALVQSSMAYWHFLKIAKGVLLVPHFNHWSNPKTLLPTFLLVHEHSIWALLVGHFNPWSNPKPSGH